MNPGTCRTGHPPKYWASLCLSPVALMRTTRRSGFSSMQERSRANSRSVLMSLSWTSSTTTWLTPLRDGLDCSFLSKTPTVRKSNAPPLWPGGRLSSLTYQEKRCSLFIWKKLCLLGPLNFTLKLFCPKTNIHNPKATAHVGAFFREWIRPLLKYNQSTCIYLISHIAL